MNTGDTVKILLATFKTMLLLGGGGATQLLKTVHHLRKKGLKVDFFDPQKTKLSDYDILHIFCPMGFPYESYFLAKYAKKAGLKVVVSTVFWLGSYKNPLTYLLEFPPVVKVAVKGLSIIPYFAPTYLLNLFKMADALLPNTSDEKELIKKIFDVPDEKFFVVPNGVSASFEEGDPSLFAEECGCKDYILFVGRIERRKNLLSLIRAFKKSKLPTKLVLIGKKHEASYYALCVKESNDNVLFFDEVSHESPMLKSAYKGAKVFVLPSYYETPGLCALEAGLAGSNVVITSIGGTKDYFNDYAIFINPKSEESIKNALIQAYNMPKNDKLKKHIQLNFLWTRVAEITIDAYQEVLGRRGMKEK